MAVAAGVRNEMFLAAMLTAVVMSAQGGGAAGDQGTQDLPMVERQTMGLRMLRHSCPQHFRQGQFESRRLDRRWLHEARSGLRGEGGKLDQVERAF